MEQRKLIEETSNLFRNAKVGDCSIDVFEVTREEAHYERMMSVLSHTSGEFYDFREGKYVRLIVGNELMMSNTPMEIRTNRWLLDNARGDVLIGGLGLGIVLYAIAHKPEVTSITVVEKSTNVIRLVTPFIKKDKYVKAKTTVVCGDVFDATTVRDRKFDVLYFDIWATIDANNYPQMKTLTKAYRKNRNKGAMLNHWRKTDCLRMHREDIQDQKRRDFFMRGNLFNINGIEV